jgi:hypothetical protein
MTLNATDAERPPLLSTLQAELFRSLGVVSIEATMKRVLVSIMITLALAACGTAAAPPTPAGTGIQGVVQAGPTCPVERINSPCPPHPLAATIVVRDAAGHEVARGHSGADGHFKVDVAPGTYTVVGLNIGSSMLPRPIPMTVTVTSGSYTSISVEYDSGIR